MNSFKLDGVLFAKNKFLYSSGDIVFDIDQSKELFILINIATADPNYIVVSIEYIRIFYDFSNRSYLYFCNDMGFNVYIKDVMMYSSNYDYIKNKCDNLNLLS